MEENGFKDEKSLVGKMYMSYYPDQIRSLEFSQIDFVISFLWHFMAKDFNQNSKLVLECFKKFIMKEMSSGLKFHGFYVDDLLAGIIGIKNDYIMFLYVLEKYQKQKIGTKLLDYIIQNLQYNTIYLDSKEASLGFYQAYGFTIDESKRKKYSIPMKYKTKEKQK